MGILGDLGGGGFGGWEGGVAIYENPGFPVSKPGVSQSLKLLGKTKSTVKAGSWSTVKPPSRRSDSRPLLCQNPQEITFEEPVKRYSWRDTLTVSLVSLNYSGTGNSQRDSRESIRANRESIRANHATKL